jgi:hypothetical protein
VIARPWVSDRAKKTLDLVSNAFHTRPLTRGRCQLQSH